jgi:hypothetical protein
MMHTYEAEIIGIINWKTEEQKEVLTGGAKPGKGG